METNFLQNQIVWSHFRSGKVDLQFIVKSFSKMHAGTRSFFIIHYIHFFEIKLMEVIHKFVRVRKPVKN